MIRINTNIKQIAIKNINKGCKAAEDLLPKCPGCEKWFKGKNSLKVHIQKIHELDAGLIIFS